ncbi:hypothetical protein R3P38DRAFT_2768481 [Favolaschia claudopus]|uniref:Uncharacterized protein n=1 Tax=Favolaschia claudopus TaxID=2862362 RepID=A0AAW0CMP8_9AGAR
MSTTSGCGQALPLPSDFDYVLWTTRPTGIPPLPNMTLKEQNQQNVRIESENASSIAFTRAYENTAKAGPVPAGLDVGKALQPFYVRSSKKLLVFSEQLRNSVSPLPTFLMEYIAGEPHIISSALKGPPKIPSIFLMSLHHDVHFPLHWWSDRVVRDAFENAGSIPAHQIDAEQTASLVKPEKVFVVDVPKAIKMLGEEPSRPILSPNEWRGASQNLLEALRLICPPVDPNNPDTKNTHHSEYDLHVKFFANLEEFEAMYEVWYPVERELRKKIFSDGLFSLD